MCGLVGVMGRINRREESIFRSMLILDQLRGLDSTGVAIVPTNQHSSIQIIKDIWLPPDIIESDEYVAALRLHNKILMGHNRAATVGEVNKENAHPFHVGNFIGMHNGTIRGRAALPDYKDFENDSHHLYHCFNEKGVEWTWERLNGAAALTWVDTQTKNLHMLKNSERPLFFTTSEDEKTLFWASEKWMVQVAAGRCNVKIKDFKSPKENYHLTFKYTHADGLTYTGKELKPYVSKVYNYNNHNRGVVNLDQRFKSRVWEGDKLWEFDSRRPNSRKFIRTREDPNQALFKQLPAAQKQTNIPKSGTKETPSQEARKHLANMSARRRKKKIGRAKAILKRRGQVQKSVDVEKLAAFIDAYGERCMVDSTHFLDPDTAEPIEPGRALCKECSDTAKEFQISPHGLKGQ